MNKIYRSFTPTNVERFMDPARTCAKYKLGSNKPMITRATRRKLRQADRDLIVELELEHEQPYRREKKGAIVGVSAQVDTIKYFWR